ncbi:MAG: hypothetical protein ACR2RL_21590 [Gammaproteobacteria bacterium]
MDDYGYLTAQDAATVAAAIAEHNAITFSFSHENGTANQVWMAKMPVALSKVQHMGADGGFIVGIYGRGTYIFDPKKEGVYPNYVGEKLYLSEADAKPLAILISGVAECLGDEKFSSSSAVSILTRNLSGTMFELKSAHQEIERLREKCGEIPAEEDAG